MIERREYVPVAILFSITIIVVYIVIYQTVMRGVRIYNEQNEKSLLETEIELQKSQLELKEIYHRMAYTDTLTGLKNRTAFEERKEALKSSNDELLSCLSMDLNNLKEINDFYGHHAGDQLIKAISEVLKKSFKELDDIYRIGGDEFILFFAGWPYDKVKKEISHLKQEISYYNSLHEIKISVAMGLVLMDEMNIKDIHSLIVCADGKMYENKRSMKRDCKKYQYAD